MAVDVEANLSDSADNKSSKHFYRFHLPHAHLGNVFGGDWFALKAEAFARFFGTPIFLIVQTVVVGSGQQIIHA